MGRLKGIPRILSPELLHVLASMGHGDEIVFADANFPACSTAKCGPRLVDASGHGVTALLKAVLQFLPLDSYSDSPAAVMDRVESDKARDLPVPVWEEYRSAVAATGEVPADFRLDRVERFAFYERAKKAFAVVATGETALYGNLILKKGVVP